MKPLTARVFSSVRALLSAKLGRCPYCMRWSALAATIAWIAVAGLAMAGVGPLVLLTAAAIALVFTALIALHVTVFARRLLEDVPLATATDRRRFLRTFVRVAGGAFSVALLGPLFLRTASAQDSENSPCAKLCNALFPKGTLRGKCKSDGAQGVGICFEGNCLPSPQASGGFKPKADPRTKIDALVASGAIPSALAGTFFHLVRRFQLGAAPANEVEEAAFPLLAGAAARLQSVLGCTVNRFDSLTRDQRSRLFGPLFERSGTNPISIGDLRTALAAELAARAGVCRIETPGRVRPFEHVDPIEGNTVVDPAPWICRLNRRRTKDFVTEGGGRLTVGEYTADELEQSCTLGPSGELLCEVLVDPGCPGDNRDGVCLRVPDVAPGEVISLEGFNFFDTNARVLLDAVTTPTIREVAAHVCGDTQTPLTETVGGVEKVIADSRVHDVLRFQVPRDLPEGLYRLTVIVPNTTGAFPDKTEFFSIPNPAIRVRVPYSGRIQISAETLFCREETGFELGGSVIRAGEDEVGIRFFAVPTSFDGSVFTPGTLMETEFRFGNIDSGNSRTMSRIVFDGAGFDAVAIAILGFEIDSESAYAEISVSLQDVVVAVLIAVLSIVTAVTLGAAGGIGLAIGAGLAYAYGLWAPADLIIDDAIALTATQLAELTSVGFPLPPAQSYRTTNGIDVVASACDPSLGHAECTSPAKAPDRYREIRGYRNGGQFSDYRMTLRYERIL